MIATLKKNKVLNILGHSFLNSYAQIFFSQNRILSIIIIVCTFSEPKLGLAGASAILISNFLAYYSGFKLSQIKEGLYGFNAMLLGLGLASLYQFNAPMYVLFFCAVVFNLINNVWINGVLEKYNLPSLSFPFLITFWIISAAAKSFNAIHINEEHIYWLNSEFGHKQDLFHSINQFLENSFMPNLIKVFFKTISAVFFLNSIFAGVLITIGIFIFSRIALSLAIIGFVCAYYFYLIFGLNVNYLYYELQGSNFIFTAIGIGCFYLIPNVYSYLSVIILTPIILFLLTFFNKIFGVFNLTVYTLPFSFIVITFLYFLRLRSIHGFLHFVNTQYYSAEKTVYKYLNALERYKNYYTQHIHFPFWGKWMVSQGHEGSITHIGEWDKALDFILLDDEMKSYKNPGKELEDFYCYNKPVVAPANGFIVELTDDVEDNKIGDVNLAQNWGNTLVIKHNEFLFSQISHLKKNSLKVNIGDYVKRGDIIASCGSSGRSPEPHLHFQMQQFPAVGAKTLSYPIAYYIHNENSNYYLKTFDIPKEGQIISNVEPNQLLVNAFNFHHGMKLNFLVNENNNTLDNVNWEVFTDSYNSSYIYCHNTNSYAYYINDGTLFYFTDFEGNKNSLLFYFYLAAYKVLLGYYQKLQISDRVPLNYFSNKSLLLIQDFFSPFYQFTKADYTLNFVSVDNEFYTNQIKLSSEIKVKLLGFEINKFSFEIELFNNKIKTIKIKNNKTNIAAKNVETEL